MIGLAYDYFVGVLWAVKMADTKVLVALDVSNIEQARTMIRELAPHVFGFKVGLELCSAAGVPAVVNGVSDQGGAVFLDLKFKDIPNTVYGAVKASCRPGVFMMNVHCDGGSEMMKAAVKAARESDSAPLMIGVTVLTSVDLNTLNDEMRVSGTIQEQAVHLALLAKDAGLNGIVCSPLEVRAIKQACGQSFVTVVPGVRPAWASTGDQKRVMTPAEAAAQGADFLVIGRPITNPPVEIGSPADAARKIIEEIKMAVVG